jgi:hypothetical protein
MKVKVKENRSKLTANHVSNGLFIYLTKACLRGKTPSRLGHLAPASEVAEGHTVPFKKGHDRPIVKWYGKSSCDLQKPKFLKSLSNEIAPNQEFI